MATYFTGTSTGNRYEVGRTYEMNGAGYTAQIDGSFRKEGNIVGRTDSGRVVYDSVGRGTYTQGSYGNPDTSWSQSGGKAPARSSRSFNTGASIANAGGAGAATTQASAARTAASRAAHTTQPGGPVAVANPSRGTAFAAARVAAAGGAGYAQYHGPGRFVEWSGIDDPPQHVMIMGHQVVASPRSSNMAMIEERYGDAEFLSPAWWMSWGVSADDYMHNVNVRVYGAEKTYDREHRAAVQKAAVEDLGAKIINWGFDTITGVRTSAANGAAIRDAGNRARAAENDAWNAREEAMWAEEQARMLRNEQKATPPSINSRFLGLH